MSRPNRRDISIAELGTGTMGAPLAANLVSAGFDIALLLSRGHAVRALVRTEAQAAALRDAGADALVAELRGDVEWTADACDAAVFAAGARHRSELGSIDAGGAAKLAEAAAR